MDSSVDFGTADRFDDPLSSCARLGYCLRIDPVTAS